MITRRQFLFSTIISLFFTRWPFKRRPNRAAKGDQPQVTLPLPIPFGIGGVIGVNRRMTTNVITDGCFADNLDYWENVGGYWSISDKLHNPECGGHHRSAKLGPINRNGAGLPNVEGILRQETTSLDQPYPFLKLTFRYLFVRGTYLRANLYGFDTSTSEWVLIGTAVEILQGARDDEFLFAAGTLANPDGYTNLRLDFVGKFPTQSLGMKVGVVSLVGADELEPEV